MAETLLDLVRASAQGIRTCFELDWDHRSNVRSWEALIEYRDGSVAAAVLHQRSDPDPTRGLRRYGVSLTLGFNSQPIGNDAPQLWGDAATPEELAVFLRLHEAARAPVWALRKQLSDKSPLVIQRGTIALPQKGKLN